MRYVMSRLCMVLFFFKQKTAYEMRISDWSSDVCSSDPTQLLDLGLERPGIEHHPVADHRRRAAHDARGQQRQFVGGIADDERVSGVVPALQPDDDIGAFGKPIDDLALALIAPLGADPRYTRHYRTRHGQAKRLSERCDYGG